MADADTYRTILPAGSITAAGNTGPLHVSSDVDPDGIDFIIDLSGFTGGASPSITFSAAWDADANSDTYPPATWGTAKSTAALTGAGRTVLTLPASVGTSTNTTPRYVQLSWTIAGAPTSVDHTGIFCE